MLRVGVEDSAVAESEEVEPRAILDYNDRGQVVGFEVLRVKERVPQVYPRQLQLEVA